MASERTKILNWFQRCSIPDGVFQFEDYLLQAVTEALNKNTLDSRQYVTAHTNRIWNYILEENRVHIKKGLIPLFSTKNFLNKTASYPPFINESQKRKRFILRSLVCRPKFLRLIDSLSFRQYEALGCLSSKLSGADKYFLTPTGNEGGVDFFARVRHPANNHIFSGNYSPMRIIGQSKKYSGKITIGQLKEFKTAIDHVKLKYGKAKDLTPDWFSSMQGPVVGWMVAHSGFQSGAIDYAKDEGIILSSTIDIAEILSFSRNFYSDLNAEDRTEQLVRSINEILVVDQRS